MFTQELICSTLFYISWIIIRNFQLTQRERRESISDRVQSKESNILNLFKPLFIAISWAASRQLFFKVSGLAICNPTITISVLFLDMLVFKPLKYRQTANAEKTSLYADKEMGRWYWVYLMGQAFAAPLAGYISGQLLKHLNNAYDNKN